ncbi:hypothetical protein BHM03_00002596 [Ensete ventricosum]|nr:hypothetical protein BHM03_00002596 [Ensete ventricosum]
MHLLDCDYSLIQPPLHPSRPSNMLNWFTLQPPTDVFFSCRRPSFDRLEMTMDTPSSDTSPCMSIEFFELAIPLTSVSFAQLFRLLCNPSHFARSHLLPSTLLAMNTDMKAMTDAAGNRPVILVNPRLKVVQIFLRPDLHGDFCLVFVLTFLAPRLIFTGYASIKWHNASKRNFSHCHLLLKDSSLTVVSNSMPRILKTMGRDKRLEYAASFENCYFFRLLYYAGTQYPIMGTLRLAPLPEI